MRNLKKVFAVILAVALMASMMVPALAAVSHEAEALKLQAIGLMAGGPADLKLEEGVTRVQGLTFAIRAAGKEADALAMTDAEVAAELAKFTDADKIPAWAKKYTAYAIKNNITVGVGGGKFAPLEPISGTSFLVFLLKSGMGYADVTTGNVVDVAYAAKVLSVSEALTYGTKTALIRDDAAAILYGAAKNGVNKDGKTLIQSLIDAGFVAKDDAVDAGFIDATPAKFEVVDVSADNLKQAVVEFNQPADKDAAGDKDNYKFATADKIAVAGVSVSEDGLSATLTFKDAVSQQKKASLTISGVKSASGVAMTKTVKEVNFLDNTIPSIVATEVVGISTIKVTFSEPMNPSSIVASSFKVNDGKYYVKGVTAQKNDTEFLVELYTSLKTGELPFEVKVGPADYAGFTAMGFIGKLAVNEDKEAPYVVSYKDAKPNSIVLVWNEDIVLANGAKANFYHTNGNNTITVNMTPASIDGNEMTLEFSNTNKLPNGTAYVYVLKDAVKDLWNNKNAQQMTKVDVEVDNDAPVLKEIKVDAENKIILKFDEKVAKANTKANYTLLDKDGKEVTNIISSAVPSDKEVTITFVKNLSGGVYTLVVKNVEDMSGNAMASTSMEFTVTDMTKPVASDFSATLYTTTPYNGKYDQILKVSFGEAMATEGAYSIADLSKYILATNGKRIETFKEVTISVVDDGKAVEITVPYLLSDGTTQLVTTGANELQIARVADAAGNYTVLLVNTVTIGTSTDITITKAELIGAKEVKVYFSSALEKFEANEVLIYKGTKYLTPTGVSTDLEKGKTVATFTLDEAFNYTASDLSVTTASPAGKNVTANSYGETLFRGQAPVAGVDKLAPALKVQGADDEDDVKVTTADGALIAGSSPAKYVKVSTITLTFEEALNPAYISYGSFDVAGFKVKSVSYVAPIVTGGSSQIVIVVEDNDQFVEVNNAITLKAPIRDNSAAGNELTTLSTSVKY